MLRLAQAPNIAIAVLWVDFLRDAGVDASLQRFYLGAAAGQLPPDQCLPEVWIAHAEQEPRARTLLAEFAELPQRRWQCENCGERIEGGFEQCWRCGRWMPQSGDSLSME